MTINNVRNFLIAGAIALYAYDQFAFFYFSITDFTYLAVIPTLIIVLTAYFSYRLLFKKSSHFRIGKGFSITETSTSDRAHTVSLLEEKLSAHRDEAKLDPNKLPELAKRLVVLSALYKEKDLEKSEAYANEAQSIVESSYYPNTEEANQIRTFVKMSLK
ncbi:MAG: hypothetical protein ACYCSO_07630 [Cuniculiplasma sp.]